MKRCKVCGLTEDYKGIVIGEDEVCSLCRFYGENEEALRDYRGLEQFFESRVEEAKKAARERNSRYDCIVGLSGGKDSTYIVYQMKHRYGMRVLTFTLDNGFSTEYGRRNIDNALEKLDVDYIRIKPRDEVLRRYYSKSLQLFHNFCGVCFHLMHYYSYLLAGQNGIPLIINGRTRGQVLQNAASPRGIEPFQISRSLGEFEYQMFGRVTEKMDQRGAVDLLHGVEAEALSYFMYHKISEEQVMEFLEREIGWQRPDCGIPHADCWAHPMAENLSLRKFGYPVRRGELAVLVREGEMTREEAEQILTEDRERYAEIDPAVLERFNGRTGAVLQKVRKKN